ncbi:MAG: tetratricopeptide repeat protein [Thermosynechococcaceae cyanobacterium]
MTPENSVATNSAEDAKLSAALEALEAARELQKLRRSHGVDRIHLLVEDVDGDWLEEWGEDEVLDSEDFQDKLGFLAALARKEELEKEFRKREEEIDQEIQSFRVKIEQRIQRTYQDLPAAIPVRYDRESDVEFVEAPPLLSENIDRIITLSPIIDFKPTADDYFRLGNARFFESRYEEAIKSYNKALELKPEHVEAWIGRGVALRNLGQHEEALESYDRALKIESNDPELWYTRGSTLNSLGRYEEAIESYDKALELKPEHVEAWIGRGVALDKLGRHGEAIESHDKALEYKPDCHRAWVNRGVALGNLGQYEKAIESCNKALALKSDDATTRFNQACLESRLGKIEQSIKNLQKAIDLDPSFREAAKTDSYFDSLRHDDRFQQLLADDNESQA